MNCVLNVVSEAMERENAEVDSSIHSDALKTQHELEEITRGE